MILRLIKKIGNHRNNILAAGSGQVMAIVGIAVGTRLLTEFADPDTFGEAKLLIGLTALVIGMVVRPYTQFAMREFHDAATAGNEWKFHAYALRGQLLISTAAAVLLTTGLVLYSRPASLAAWIIPPAVGVMLVGQALFELEQSMFITRNRQVLASILISVRQWSLPLGSVLLIACTSSNTLSFIAGQTVVWGLLLWMAFKMSAIPKAAGALPGEAAEWKSSAIRFVTPMLALGVFQWIVSIGDRYIMAGYVDMVYVGKYAAVYGLISAPFLAAGALTSRLVNPFAFRAAARRDHVGQSQYRWGMLGVTTVVACAGFLSVLFLGPTLAWMLLAKEYREGILPLMNWIAAGYGLLIISYTFDLGAYAAKKTFVMTIAYGVAAVVKIIGNLVLIPRIGILGAAQTTFFTFATYFVIMAWFDYRRRKY